MARKPPAASIRWERWDHDTESAVIGVQTRRPERHETSTLRGFLHLAVTEQPTTWAWRTQHITLSDDGGEIAAGTAATRDLAQALAVHASECYLRARGDDGLYGTLGGASPSAARTCFPPPGLGAANRPAAPAIARRRDAGCSVR